ncbi:methyltransferase domain-containing protein [Winogradskyella sp. A3E31]|uniref:methyltransferase domain-containing protein n=1 Tax=Winogradskyella sp. A3E31 TaxID=3349637 RepID=UPI00398BBC70
MKKNKFDESYWENRYQNNETAWDIGHISTPLKEYFNQLEDKSLKILIPGCGHGYEAEYLFESGFKNVFTIDLALAPLKSFKKRAPLFPDSQIIYSDFFGLQMSFDLIIEQTFFCALHLGFRINYVRKMHSLLNPNGKLVGLLFDFPLTESGPPFGGDAELYKSYFQKHFLIKTLSPSYNSIPSRKDKELFFIFEKKQQ